MDGQRKSTSKNLQKVTVRSTTTDAAMIVEMAAGAGGKNEVGATAPATTAVP